MTSFDMICQITTKLLMLYNLLTKRFQGQFHVDQLETGFKLKDAAMISAELILNFDHNCGRHEGNEADEVKPDRQRDED
jgi:hypothetical protein